MNLDSHSFGKQTFMMHSFGELDGLDGYDGDDKSPAPECLPDDFCDELDGLDISDEPKDDGDDSLYDDSAAALGSSEYLLELDLPLVPDDNGEDMLLLLQEDGDSSVLLDDLPWLDVLDGLDEDVTQQGHLSSISP